MQAVGRWRPPAVALLIGLFALLTAVALVQTDHGVAEAASLTAFYCGVNAFFAGYAWAVRRAVEARERNDVLAADLRETNRRLTASAAQAERLGAARERQRLARDLHDSVTQTLFSMTLTAQSALLLLRAGPRRWVRSLTTSTTSPATRSRAGRARWGVPPELRRTSGWSARSSATAPSASCATGCRSAWR